MVLISVGTPCRLEMKRIEVYILVEDVEQVNRDLRRVMRICTVVTIFARVCRFNQKCFAELRLVHFRMVKFFDNIMRVFTRITLRTNLLFSVVHFGAQIALVGA